MHTVLHLHWRPADGPAQAPTILIWAETNEAPQPVRQRGRLAAQPRPRSHPFALADGAALRRFLQLFDATMISGRAEPFALHLPSSRTGPLPSPELTHPWELDTAHLFLAPWQITGLRLPPASALSFLHHLYRGEGPERPALGADILFWRKAFDLVLEILAQQHYVPSLASTASADAPFRAIWQPVWDGGDLPRRLRRLAEAMPPLCRAGAEADGDEPAPHQLLRAFVEQNCDLLVRSGSNDAPHRIVYLHNRACAAAWLKALVSDEATVPASSNRLYEFAAEMKAWQRNLAPIGDTGFAIALRLHPPPQSSDNGHFHVPASGWRIEYLLQAREEPTLLAPAESVWQAPGESLILAEHRFVRPQEKLLAGLGQAANLFPPIERSLQDPTPTHVDLNTTEVYEFLRQAAPALKQSGFALILPQWWEEAAARLGLRIYLTPLTPAPPDVAHDPESSRRPISYRWELALGDTILTRQAFTELVALRSPLVQKAGRWLRLDPEQIEAAARFLDRQSFEGRMDLQQALRVALGLDNKIDISGLPVERVITEGWLTEVIASLSQGDEAMRQAAQPAALHGALRPYQRFGFAWLHRHRQLGLGACLADDMGLGKSIQAIALLLQEQAEMQGLPAATLLICPTSLLGNWRREFERFAPGLRLFIHHGSERPRAADLAAVAARHDVLLTSYTLARRDAEALEQTHWYGLILDEAQKIKNPETLVAQAVQRFSAHFRLALTGTPVENRLTELWSIFNFLNRGYLGSYNSFNKHFALPIERYQDQHAAARLARMVKPFILRRLKSDPNVIQDLPDRQEMKVYCTLSEEQAALYQRVVDEGLPRIADLRGRARRLHIFNLLTRLKQVLNHPLHYLRAIDDASPLPETLSRRSGKLDRLTEMLEEVLDVGDRALIFTQFAEMGHLLTEHLQQQFDRPVLYLHGRVPAARRQAMITHFQEDPHAPSLFVLTLQTGGLGLNLTAANHVFHFDRWWNPAVERQASDRAYRIGQTRNVQIHQFITAGTLEEAIDELLERKKGLAEAIIGEDEGWLADLSDADLSALLQLDKDRV